MQYRRFRPIAACALALAAFSPPVMAGAALDEANRSFTFESRPIHPYLVQEFANWMSDFRPPMTTAVDVAAAADSNEYAVAVANGADGARCAEERNADAKLGVRGSFCYRYVGRLESGAHVLKTISSSEGSGSFASVMLVRFDEGTILWQGRLEPQLRMSVIATQALQQGTGETLKLSGNKILVSTGTDAAIPTGARSAGAAPAFDELDFAQAIAATPAPASAQAPPPASAPAAVAAAPVGETVEYHCGSGSNLIATYYAEEDRAVVSYHGRAALMQISMSASGARYLGGGWVWWTRGMTEGSLFNATANGEAGKQLEQCTAPDEAAPATEPGR